MFARKFRKIEWDAMVKEIGVDAKSYYSYENFKKAAIRYPEFSKGPRDAVRREIAAFLANTLWNLVMPLLKGLRLIMLIYTKPIALMLKHH